MSTFDGIVQEFPHIRIDDFTLHGQRPLACFLSHVHSDHLRGLESLKSPFVYCSAITKELLLKLERYPHRINFAKGVLEWRKRTYRHLQKVLRPIPLNTPTTIELWPGNLIRVTLFDANHCPGAVSFLVEGNGKAIVYTGDIRSEVWHVESLVRSPFMIPYTLGSKRLDNLYLDTTFASDEPPLAHFPSKADGIRELLDKVTEYPPETVFYFNAWTFGYEEVWLALSAFISSQIHVDEYRWKLFSSLNDSRICDPSERAALNGYALGNDVHAGCLTRSETGVHIHSCERGTQCDVFQSKNIVNITPIVTRYKGVEYAEMGAGGGHGDLNHINELEMEDVSAVGSLMQLCSAKLKDRPALLEKLLTWLSESLENGGTNLKLDTTTFWEDVHGGEQVEDVGDTSLDQLVLALEKLVEPKKEEPAILSSSIRFPYSRHASLEELRYLVKALRPRALVPCTVEPGLDMDALFGDLLLADGAPATTRPDAASTLLPDKKTPAAPSTPDMAPPTGDRKRKILSETDTHESIVRRRQAYTAALGQNGSTWADGVSLTSVSGYHNEKREEEL